MPLTETGTPIAASVPRLIHLSAHQRQARRGKMMIVSDPNRMHRRGRPTTMLARLFRHLSCSHDTDSIQKPKHE